MECFSTDKQNEGTLSYSKSFLNPALQTAKLSFVMLQELSLRLIMLNSRQSH